MGRAPGRPKPARLAMCERGFRREHRRRLWGPTGLTGVQRGETGRGAGRQPSFAMTLSAVTELSGGCQPSAQAMNCSCGMGLQMK